MLMPEGGLSELGFCRTRSDGSNKEDGDDKVPWEIKGDGVHEGPMISCLELKI